VVSLKCSIKNNYIKKMADNEHTSKEIASFASEILRMDKPPFVDRILWEKIKAVAGSALTQTQDHPSKIPPEVADIILSALKDYKKE
jgi:hypothetical protein